jgi:hypothetical protein
VSALPGREDACELGTLRIGFPASTLGLAVTLAAPLRASAFTACSRAPFAAAFAAAAGRNFCAGAAALLRSLPPWLAAAPLRAYLVAAGAVVVRPLARDELLARDVAAAAATGARVELVSATPGTALAALPFVVLPQGPE